MQLDRNSVCGDVVLDSVNMALVDEDNICDKICKQHIYSAPRKILKFCKAISENVYQHATFMLIYIYAFSYIIIKKIK